jgi:hypothetical protein
MKILCHKFCALFMGAILNVICDEASSVLALRKREMKMVEREKIAEIIKRYWRER